MKENRHKKRLRYKSLALLLSRLMACSCQWASLVALAASVQPKARSRMLRKAASDMDFASETTNFLVCDAELQAACRNGTPLLDWAPPNR